MNRLFWLGWIAVFGLSLGDGSRANAQVDARNPLFAYLTQVDAPKMITYTPSELDPRQPANQGRLATSSIRKDLTALRPVFDGLVLYGYHEACTPRVVALAAELKFKAVILAIWDPKSTAEVDGVADLAKQFAGELAIGILVGNEGITFKRYETDDIRIAASRLRSKLPKSIPLSTSEPLVGYGNAFIAEFGDFLAPNIHPVFDREAFAAADAANWAREEATKLAKRTKKPVLLKETGFPHGGKPAYTAQSQAEFWTAYLKPGRFSPGTDGAWVFTGVAFDSFDMPWKTQESGLPIEQFWGLFSKNREPFPALTSWKSAPARP
ncbi:glycoside hydrolase family 17 protein [Tuwongella immobilis]|uniref:Endo-1,3-beta-glucanase btgC n=1 Tax=Tuwongella immobilis TaxID=692036 RepID=A0A6C2YIR7_9BACT|nr:exo-beta-1,3-glucanase [Tuwongella immobilis]VIP01306.1 exo-beta-1 3-glucanase-like protein : Exo-beta-1 3-glucanase-like protein OS=Isosphaera pallida (strain ATCC 43644 / DSM 9630 / IS1B) GN=Isop_3439 PE=4 SV=1 [Tuwongella immobilis]VTR98038.1 exo-beta-1 3-glucanase-like protein : Exo-beta-1 3-glucanase-like protein OS=Isosphaera pallida (strain ATCC 43644 / DSM 9630 / IS1B) GN=Isop_3439 PE=4 SV=1 [Tuwongella immobilis]